MKHFIHRSKSYQNSLGEDPWSVTLDLNHAMKRPIVVTRSSFLKCSLVSNSVEKLSEREKWSVWAQFALRNKQRVAARRLDEMVRIPSENEFSTVSSLSCRLLPTAELTCRPPTAVSQPVAP
jgi:hypothetical protein